MKILNSQTPNSLFFTVLLTLSFFNSAIAEEAMTDNNAQQIFDLAMEERDTITATGMSDRMSPTR